MDTQANSPNKKTIDPIIEAFQMALRHIKKIKNRHCYLIIGAQASGKTGLLKYSQLVCNELFSSGDIFSSTSLNNDPSLPKYTCVDNQALFAEIPDILLSEKKHHPKWITLLNLLKKYKKNCPIHGIIILFDLKTIMSQSQYTFCSHIKNRLIELNKKLSTPIPVYTVFNKADLINGFSEFFGHLSQEEQQQPWGITFHSHLKQAPLKERISMTFRTFLEKLHTRVLTRLHGEPNNIQRRIHINDFPLQVESLQYPINHCINQLFDAWGFLEKLYLRGIYFTSNIQQGYPINRLAVSIQQALALPSMTSSGERYNCSFFTHGLIKNIIFNDTYKHVNNTNNRRWVNIIVLLGSLIFFSLSYTIYLWKNDFENHIKQIDSIEHRLSLYHLTNNLPEIDVFSRFTKINTRLNIIRDSIWTTNDHYATINPGVAANKALLTTLKNTYLMLLNRELLPFLDDQLSDLLEAYQQTKSEKLYEALEAYLRLTQKKYRDNIWISNWFYHHLSTILNKTIPQNILKEFSKHIEFALQHNNKNLDIDKQLIKSSRNILLSLPQETIKMIIFEHNHSTIPIIAPPLFNSVFVGNNDINSIYTKANFVKTYFHSLPNHVKESLDDNWVLGNPKQQIANQTNDSAQLIIKTQHLYANRYISQWKDIINELHFKQVKTLDEAIDLLSIIKKDDSPLAQIIHAIQVNTQQKHIPLINKLFPQKLFNDLWKNRPYRPYLDDLYQHLLHITHGDNPNALAFEYTKERMNRNGSSIDRLRDYAKQLPQPIQNWLTDLADQCWNILLLKSAKHLNTVWTQEIIPIYKQSLAGHYPFDRMSTNDADFSEFVRFFSTNGQLDHFFVHYLKPFLDTSRPNWTLKTIDGKNLPISETIVHQFKHAAIIQRIFFPHNSKNPQIHFQLKPVSLGQFSTGFSIKFANKRFFYSPNAVLSEPIHWTTQTAQSPIDIRFIDLQNKATGTSIQGPWAWLRLVDASLVENTADYVHYLLSINYAGHLAQYELIAESPANPFRPKLFTQFQLSEYLT